MVLATRTDQEPTISDKHVQQKASTVLRDGVSLIKVLQRIGLTVFGGFVVWLGWEVGQGQYYTSRSPIGFNLGVVGALMMVALLGYPLRKHIRFMHRWGPLKHWFRIHMFLGLTGPTLILFHATFQTRSVNAGVALTSMALVVASGVIGRFIYSKIHRGLYGRRNTLQQIREEFSRTAKEATANLSFAPRIEHWLKEFERNATKPSETFAQKIGKFFPPTFQGILVRFRCVRELRKAFKQTRHEALPMSKREARKLVSMYIDQIQRVAQFQAYERMFSMWHILHIPLIYLLAATAIFHVIAVYMY